MEVYNLEFLLLKRIIFLQEIELKQVLQETENSQYTYFVSSENLKHFQKICHQLKVIKIILIQVNLSLRMAVSDQKKNPL
jgi:hypothetical protein